MAMMTMRERVHENAKAVIGMSVEEIKDTSPEDFRMHCERRSGEAVRFVPGDGLVMRCELDADVDGILEGG